MEWQCKTLYGWHQVLDLMVRMLGFTDEDKQKIGVAQQGAGKGVVRGVLGLPGRLVGGIMGGSPAGSSASTASDNQAISFKLTIQSLVYMYCNYCCFGLFLRCVKRISSFLWILNGCLQTRAVVIIKHCMCFIEPPLV